MPAGQSSPDSAADLGAQAASNAASSSVSNYSVSNPVSNPVPNYGTLGPGSDIQSDLSGSQAPRAPKPTLVASILAVTVGVFFALLVGNIGSAHAGWAKFSVLFASQGDMIPPALPALKDPHQFDGLKPQKQAEDLLELAVGRSDGAVEQISSRVERWQGKLKWTPQIATLTTAALNSSDMRVRESGIEVELAALGLSTNSASFEYLLQTAKSSDHAKKVWALWALGLMGNRGFETGRIIDVLDANRKDADPDSRQWAVEGLALAGASESIPLLLASMHDDPSPDVRERAACGIAAAGMFSAEQRFSAVPQLVIYTDDPALDAKTHTLAFQALAAITHQHLPSNSEAWRSWYQRQN
jgi:hypothetical protein